MRQNKKEPKWISALLLKHSDIDIQVGDRIRIYNKETTVEGFFGSYNEGLERWETIIMTTKRGDPFERSLDVIEVDENKEYRSPYAESKPPPVIEIGEQKGEKNDSVIKPDTKLNANG